jgi:hypothetical protein
MYWMEYDEEDEEMGGMVLVECCVIVAQLALTRMPWPAFQDAQNRGAPVHVT